MSICLLRNSSTVDGDVWTFANYYFYVVAINVPTRGPLAGVKVLDFGISKVLTVAEGSDGVKGTWGYMSPEQLCGEPATPRSDVFSLGATLYHLLTGAPPFTGTQKIVIQKTLEGRIELPRTQNPFVPKDLETICMKALEHAADGRYPSVHRMVEDLEKWQKGEAISARPIGPFEKAFRFTRKHFVPVSLGGLLVVLLTAFTESHRSDRPVSFP